MQLATIFYFVRSGVVFGWFIWKSFWLSQK